MGVKKHMKDVNGPQLGFGIMRLPLIGENVDMRRAREVIDAYMQGEFCYFDTHPVYMNGKSQDIIRELVVEKYPRESFLLANKMPYDVESTLEYELIFDQELRACGVSYFDYYMLHALQKEPYERHERLGGFSFLKQKKAEGKIHHIGFSFHDKPELLEEILRKHSEIDFVQLQINYLDWESPVICARKCYEVVRSYGKQIIVMEPIKGGGLANPTEKISNQYELAALALSFVAKLPGIYVILSGMARVEHVQQNRRTLADKSAWGQDEGIYDQLRDSVFSRQRIQCTSCRYCVRECPQNIAIPDILSLLNIEIDAGEHATYRSIIQHTKTKASDCIQCGCCEKRCPQKIEIRVYMHKAARIFERGNNNMNYYTSERNTQILIYLMKKHGIKKVVASPGATNINFVGSIQQDNDFEVYSSADERSAAYLACGLAAESGEPVALSCTGATASRNYMPALTEAYYRKIPVLAITSTQPEYCIGNMVPQVIDRTAQPKDVVKLSVSLPNVNNSDDEWICELRANKALLELRHRDMGPVHINLATTYNSDFSTRLLPEAQVVDRIVEGQTFPPLMKGRIGIFVGAHKKWDDKLKESVERFCEAYDAVVLCDHTSNYKGKHSVLASLILHQEQETSGLNDFDVLIHMGEVSGAYLDIHAQQVWRLSRDGELCDTFRKLRYVFEMEEHCFFERYAGFGEKVMPACSLVEKWQNCYHKILDGLAELPFSNVWVAKVTSRCLPENSVLHLGILNSLRCWNFFEIPESVCVYTNTGGFGIDGCVSSLLGGALAAPEKLHIGVVGDLAFFYDMNVLGNRHMRQNFRLIIVNNGCGTEFKNYGHLAAQFGNDADAYIAAKGHYGNQSPLLLKHYAEDLGFEYLSASGKEEYEKILPRIVDPVLQQRPLIVELFTNAIDESDALKVILRSNGETASTVVSATQSQPRRVTESGKKWNVVLWGCGRCFAKNLANVKKYCKAQYVCTNSSERWGKEIVQGVLCISPEQLSEMKDLFVVLMMDNNKSAFQVSNQLLDMGITSFDLVYNWLDYADCGCFQ